MSTRFVIQADVLLGTTSVRPTNPLVARMLLAHHLAAPVLFTAQSCPTDMYPSVATASEMAHILLEEDNVLSRLEHDSLLVHLRLLRVLWELVLLSLCSSLIIEAALWLL